MELFQISLLRDMSPIKSGRLKKALENALAKWHAAKIVVFCLKVMRTWLGKDVSEPHALDLRTRQTTNNENTMHQSNRNDVKPYMSIFTQTNKHRCVLVPGLRGPLPRGPFS